LISLVLRKPLWHKGFLTGQPVDSTNTTSPRSARRPNATSSVLPDFGDRSWNARLTVFVPQSVC
jgi:hypothetical protein